MKGEEMIEIDWEPVACAYGCEIEELPGGVK